MVFLVKLLMDLTSQFLAYTGHSCQILNPSIHYSFKTAYGLQKSLFAQRANALDLIQLFASR
jgi:hypothetical protein